MTYQCIFVSLACLAHYAELSTALDFPYQHKHGMFDSQFEHLVLHFKWSDVTKITIRNWDWKQLVDPRGFQWSSNTPFSEPSVIFYTWFIYFSVIMGLKLFMKDRPAYKLRKVTAIHNLFLLIISLGMFLVVSFALIEQIYKIGSKVYCRPPKENHLKKGLEYWALYTFYLSKFPELIDTVILVLKKKPVIFLHWYHHSSVIVLCWYWMYTKISFGMMPMLLNTLVHVFMYYYYFASSLGWDVWYKKYITMGQILQFCTLGLFCFPYYYYSIKNHCDEWSAWYLAVAINVSFLTLFLQFYSSAYKNKKNSSTTSNSETKVVKSQKIMDEITEQMTPKVKKIQQMKQSTIVRRSPRLQK